MLLYVIKAIRSRESQSSEVEFLLAPLEATSKLVLESQSLSIEQDIKHVKVYGHWWGRFYRQPHN